MNELPTLDELIAGVEAGTYRRNAYIRHKDFKELYVRYTRRMLGAQIRSHVLDIGVIEAKNPGKGAFTRLVRRIRKKYPHVWLYVESVLNERFAKKLLSMGFTQQGESISPSFYMPPKEGI